MARASRVGIEVDVDALPLHPAAVELFDAERALELRAGRRRGLRTGAQCARCYPRRAAARGGRPSTTIGRVVSAHPGEVVALGADGRPLARPSGGWGPVAQHARLARTPPEGDRAYREPDARDDEGPPRARAPSAGGSRACSAPATSCSCRGPLGAGKTTLVQGVGSGLGVPGPVASPTFVLLARHDVPDAGDAAGEPSLALPRRPLPPHRPPREVRELQLAEQSSDGALLIEWPERGLEALPEEQPARRDRAPIRRRPEERRFTIVAIGERYHRIVDGLGGRG